MPKTEGKKPKPWAVLWVRCWQVGREGDVREIIRWADLWQLLKPCLSFEFLQVSSVLGLQCVANEGILLGIIGRTGSFQSFSPECSVCLQNATDPFVLLFPFCVEEEWSCWLICGAFMCRHELWDFGLYGSKSCYYIRSTFPVFSAIVLEQLLGLFVSDTWPLPLSAHLDQGC